MTKDASFKKVVRRHAEETGQRYTEALTDLKGLGARMHHEPIPERLLAHLRDRYGIDPVAATKLSVHKTYVFRIDRNDGSPWIALAESGCAADEDQPHCGSRRPLRKHRACGLPPKTMAYPKSAKLTKGRHYRVNGSSRWLKAQAFCLIPEQVSLSNAPRQPPLSRWIPQIDRKFIR
jgi:hypothetical protein